MPAQLFGGAITLAIPGTFLDVRYPPARAPGSHPCTSTLRQVPDNQEVWVEREAEASIIVELVQTPPGPTDAAYGPPRPTRH